MSEADPAAPIGQEINGPGPRYFDDVVLDNLLDAMMELSAELWACRDRQYVLERVLAGHGIDAAGEIESYRPGEADLAARKALRERLVGQVFASFLKRPE